MRSLSNNTLEDIAKYNDKTFKLFNYLSQSDQPLMISEMAKISQTPDTVELLEAFRKDVTSTASMIEKAHALLSTVNDKDIVAQLKGSTKDLKKAFGDNYNPQNKSINMGGIILPLKVQLNKNDIRNIVIQSILGISSDDFDVLYKKRKSIYKLDSSSLTNDDERIEFLSIVKYQKDYEEVVQKIEALHNSFISLRATFSEEEKQKIDREITFTRSMVDSVAKQSTYLSQDDGIMQIGNDHKEQRHLLDDLLNKVKKSPYIKAVELDKDASLENVIQVVDQLSEINLGLGKEVVFKVRKLGNYNVNGMYVDSQSIVAVDISHPSSMIHEFTHAIDFSNEMLSSTVDGQNLINRFKYKIDRDGLPEAKQNYYLKNIEVMARLGEVAYIFDRYKITETENITDFINRVKDIQAQEDETQLSMVKPIGHYISKQNKHVYFNLTSWSKEDIEMCQQYYAGLFNADNKALKKMEVVPVFQEPAKVIERSPIKRYEKKPVSMIDENNIEFLMDYNEKHNVISFEKLLQEIMYNPVHLSRTTKAYNKNKFADQKATMDRLANWLDHKQDPYLFYQIYKHHTDLIAPVKFHNEMFFYQAIKDNKQDLFKGQDWLKEESDIIRQLMDRQKQLNKEKNFEASHEITRQIRIVQNSAYKKTKELLEELYPGFEKESQAKRYAFVIDEGKKKLHSSAQLNLFKSCINVTYNYMANHGIDKVLLFDDKKANMVEKTLNFKNLSSSPFKNHVLIHKNVFDNEEQTKNLRSLLKYFNVFENMENKTPFKSNLEAVVRAHRGHYSSYSSFGVENVNLISLYQKVLPEYSYGNNMGFYNPISLDQQKEKIVTQLQDLPLNEIIKPIYQAENKSSEYDNLRQQYNPDKQTNNIEDLMSLAQMLEDNTELKDKSEKKEDVIKARRPAL